MLLLDLNLRYFSRKHIVSLHKFNEPADSQVIIDHSGKGNHLTNGAIAGADANDIVLDGIKGVFGGANYCREESYGSLLGNSLVSLVDGMAFVEDDERNDWSNYEDMFLVLTDDMNVKCGGWIRAAGDGLTYGIERLSDPTFDNPGVWTMQAGWSVSGGKAVMTDSSTTIYTSTDILVGMLIESEIVCDSYTKGAYYTRVGSDSERTTYSTTGTKNDYKYVIDSSYLGISALGVSTASFTDLSFKQVLTPSTNGCTIFDAKTGGLQNWKFIEDGFDGNNVVSYEILSGDFFINQNITLGAMIKPDADGTIGVIAGNWHYPKDGQGGLCSFFKGTDNVVKLYSENGVVDADDVDSVTSSTVFTDTDWVFVLITRSASGAVQIYRNAVLVGSGTISTIGLPHNTFKIGVRNAIEYFTGEYISTCIYSRSLPELEVSRINHILFREAVVRSLI